MIEILHDEEFSLETPSSIYYSIKFIDQKKIHAYIWSETYVARLMLILKVIIKDILVHPESKFDLVHPERIFINDTYYALLLNIVYNTRSIQKDHVKPFQYK